MSRRLRITSEFFFVLTEAVAWALVLGVCAALVERSTIDALRAELEAGLAAESFSNLVGAAQALDLVSDASRSAFDERLVVAVIIAAFAAFGIGRTVTRLRLGAVGTVLGLLLSILALNALLHLALAGDLRIWDSSGFARFIDDPQSPFVGDLQVETFIEDPDISRLQGSSFLVVIVGLFAEWFRFLWAGRGRITFERVLRSFTVSFPLVLLAAFAASAAGIGVGALALAYFVLGVVGLAVANAARAVDQGDEVTRAAPWALSLLGSVGVIGGVAAAFALLAFLQVDAALAPIADAVIGVVTWVLVLILTPIFWVVEGVVGFLFGGADLTFLREAMERAQQWSQPPDSERQNDGLLPGWVRELARLAVLAVLAAGVYFLARFIFRRFDARPDDDYSELRDRGDEAAGIGRLLRNLVPGRDRTADDARWIERHAVYRLFARSVGDAEDRGFLRRPGETPIEFATAASRRLGAPMLAPIAEEFDRARYGRHYTPDAQLVPLAQALMAWEQDLPITEQLRREMSRDIAPEIRQEPDIERPDDDITRMEQA